MQSVSDVNRLRIGRVSLDDIERALRPKKHIDPKDKLPKHYWRWIAAFSQQLADQLPPHRPGVDHKIPLKRDRNGVEEPPPYGPLYGMNKEELLYLRKTLTDLLGKNFIRVSQSPAAAPILLVRKPGGGVRFCVDYRGLNERTVKDRYPLPLIRETLRNMGHARWFTKLDIIAAFHKIRIHPGEEWKTAFRTRYGLYEWNVTPFGLTGAPATFQRYINQTLREYLDDFVSAYVDDIIIYSNGTLADHRRKVGDVLQKLIDAGLQCDIAKSEFEQKSVKYLGFIVEAGKGIHVDPKKVEAIRAWERPKSIRDVRSFIGFANFYRPFIPRFADLSAPLTRLMKKDAIFEWDDNCQQAFVELKELFINAPILAHFEEDRQTVVETDASGWATGAVLSQYGPDRQLRPCAYLSQKLSPAESNYEIHDKELLAIIRALREWRPELKMVPRFTIVTDHKNLRYFGKAQHLNERQMRWADLLTEFDFDLRYRPGKLAVRPDALSRRSQDMPQSITDERLSNRFRVLLKKVKIKIGRLDPQPADHQSNEAIDFERDIPLFEEEELQAEWKRARASDSIYQRISHALLTGERRIAAETDIKTSLSECHLDDRGVLHFRQRIWIPDNEVLRTGIIQKIHDSHVTAHPGRDATYSILSRRFFWPGAAKDVRRFLRNCTICGRSSVWRDTKHGLLKPLPIPQRIWAEISVDFITGLPPSRPTGATNCMVITDRLTKGVILIGMKNTTAEDVAEVFFTHFYMHHGVPLAIVSDRGPQFVSSFWERVCERLSIQRRLSTAFHPQTDGATERANQEIERILRLFTTYSQDNWKDLLPIVAVAINNRDAASTGISPFFFTHGYHVDPIGIDEAGQLEGALTPPRKAGETFVNRLREATDWAQAAIASAQALQEEQANRRRQAAPVYKKDDWVWLNLRNIRTRRPSKKLDWLHARYRVVDVPSPFTVRLNVPTGIHPVFHIELVRPAATDPFPSQLVDDSQPPPLLVDGEEEYEVEQILAIRRRKIGRGYRDEALVKWRGWAEQTWETLDSVRDCSALDTFEEQHGTVSEVIRQQIGTEAHAVVPLMRLRLGGGYCHGPVPDIGHVYHETLAY
ncbi:hypothetical protein PMG11_03668 [Penicillium brasilianum]|uniref:Reverse transcriptase n=1 Tax=Penicillium brasilianum TaxID=104259 RepID=A0A0F7VE39_PENBI|nr:hypothetical protein PMG11_10457 [Penicillium brasilianum]CEO58976.1 hypothetical protein PMG11_03668 [Penicillium brasilianum]